VRDGAVNLCKPSGNVANCLDAPKCTRQLSKPIARPVAFDQIKGVCGVVFEGYYAGVFISMVGTVRYRMDTLEQIPVVEYDQRPTLVQ
jgi:hypothetical protein